MTAAPTVQVPRAREVRTHLARARRAQRAAAGKGQERDWYTPLLAVAVLTGLLVQGVRRVMGAEASPLPHAPHVGLLLGAVGLVLAGLVLRAALALGPMLAGPAVRHWLLAGTVDRAAMLRPRYLALAVAATLAGAGGGALAALVAAVAPPWWEAVWWAATGAGAAAALASAAVMWQAGDARTGRSVGTALVAAGAASVAAALLVPRASALPALPAPAATTAAWVLALLLFGYGWRRLGVLDRAALGAGSGLAAAVQAAGTFMEPALLLGLLEERRWRSARHGRSRPGRGFGYGALVHSDLRRVLRTPGAVALAVGLLLVTYAAAGVLPAVAVPPVAVVAAYAVASRVASGVRAVTRSAALRRSVGGTDRALIMVHLVAPLVAVAVWTAALLPALLLLNPIAVLLIPLGAVAVVERSATRPAPDYGAAVFETGMGGVQVDLVRQLVRGPALLAGLAAVQLLLPR
ncbi:DUF6297 family protein [Pseudonocardia alaniniphila]|uniref:DUF6297 family protein n=1 Tax=Pseudonocardia alaniniphila TaxID=75291 RepID=A0ABS9TG23_9PSEU|nr:DUF6297 family protein [Pseudonocardia alaniniphila]MCH6167490.1 DUF6297 family protein [Pseudonocardia alaniniphila]